MGKVTGVLEIKRETPKRRPVAERVHDWQEVYLSFEADKLQKQGARCMDCGIPFCHQGCPLGNLIPDWNDLVYRDRWREALDRLHSTNNFPEFTGLVCPAPCEAACVLGINDDPVTIKQIEWEISRRGWEEGWIRPVLPERRTGRNFGAGMSGGIAYVLDEEGEFEARVNLETVDLDPMSAEDLDRLQRMVRRHFQYTRSKRADEVLRKWDAYAPKFVKVFPKDLKLALDARLDARTGDG